MPALSDEQVLNVITHGAAGVGKSPAMTAFAEVLNDDDARDFVAYLRTLCFH